jgi:hypothetical protein
MMGLPPRFTKEETYFTVVTYDSNEGQWFMSGDITSMEEALSSKERLVLGGNPTYIVTNTIVRSAT